MKAPEKQCNLSADVSFRSRGNRQLVTEVDIDCRNCEYFMQTSTLDEMGIEDAEEIIREETRRQAQACNLLVPVKPGVIERLFGLRKGRI